MTWKRHFRTVNTGQSGGQSVVSSSVIGATDERAGAGTSAKYASHLPEVYAGHPNRIQRYYQYEEMDRDSDINAALDTIAYLCMMGFSFAFMGILASIVALNKSASRSMSSHRFWLRLPSLL